MNDNIKIIYEDKYIIAVHKPAGLATQTKKLGEKDLFSQVKNYLNGAYVGIINRLDQPVEGIVLMAKDSQSAALLSEQIQNGKTDKYYKALVYITNAIDEEANISNSTKNKLVIGKGPILLADYMKKDPASNLSQICDPADPDAKEARLEYTVVDITQSANTSTRESISTCTDSQAATATLDIHLLTGRHHQIRLQLSNAGMPILGDSKYGSTESRIYSRENRIRTVQLCAYKYAFTHPKTHERVELTLPN